MFLVPLSNEQKLIRQGFDITFNPPPDGNCQFSAIVISFAEHWNIPLCDEVVSYLINNHYSGLFGYGLGGLLT